MVTEARPAVFDPAGLWGLIYWYGIYPLHARIFQGMLAAVAERAVKEAPAAG